MKSVLIRSYSGPHFPAFGLNAEKYGVCLRIQSECGKKRTKITPNTDDFYGVKSNGSMHKTNRNPHTDNCQLQCYVHFENRFFFELC